MFFNKVREHVLLLRQIYQTVCFLDWKVIAYKLGPNINWTSNYSTGIVILGPRYKGRGSRPLVRTPVSIIPFILGWNPLGVTLSSACICIIYTRLKIKYCLCWNKFSGGIAIQFVLKWHYWNKNLTKNILMDLNLLWWYWVIVEAW